MRYTKALADALHCLLGDKQTNDDTADLIAGAKEAMVRRETNTVHGGLVISALIKAGHSYREIEQLTGIPRATAQRWAAPPERSSSV